LCTKAQSEKTVRKVDVKRDIQWRVNLSYIIVVAIGLAILGKAFYIQQVEGNYWKSMSDSLHQKIINTDAERGTIYSEDGQMLSTSIPEFDIYIDFNAEGLRENNGKRFKQNIDSLSICLSKLFKDKSAADYKKILNRGYTEKNRYFLLKKKMNYREYQLLKTFPLVRLGKNKSGFIADVKSIRLNPYQILAFRTIGLNRDSFKVGLEMRYDSVLTGKTGKRPVRYIAGGVYIPIDDYEIEPENGKDVITTLDVNIQDITENALMKMMQSNEAEHGCAIVMEVKTGKIKAIANLGRKKDGSYWEDYNYAITPTEPGSTFKLATLLALLEDRKTNLNQVINIEGGVWKINGETVYDSEKHGLNNVTVKEAFEHSSNVAMAKMAWMYYSNNPRQFVNHLAALRMDTVTGIDLAGERFPTIHKPGTKYWSNTTLPWMGFGYNLTVSPLQTLMLYNAVANNGVMLKPYLVNAIQQDGKIVEEFKPIVLHQKICSDETLRQLNSSLQGVVTNGTGRSLKSNRYRIAGKTGTALVANGSRGYADKVYQSSFAGFFPAEHPQYSIIVVIKNKPHAAKFYGAAVAGPVFKEIADKLYTLKVSAIEAAMAVAQQKDSAVYSYTGFTKDVTTVADKLQMKYSSNVNNATDWAKLTKQNNQAIITTEVEKSDKQMPRLNGMGLKDAVYLCENLGLKVIVNGRGKVVSQSITQGQAIARGQVVQLGLN
jgi:cell division protein FtsI (penicillin-binding protein 3)